MIASRQDKNRGMECCICWHAYDAEIRPVVGSCGHSICAQCLPSLASTDCPTCRVFEAFDDAPENYLAKDLLSHIASLKSGRCSSFSPAPSTTYGGNTTLARVTEMFHGELENSEQFQNSLSSALDANASLQRVVQELTDQNECLQSEIIGLAKLLNEERRRSQDLNRKITTFEESLKNRQRDLDVSDSFGYPLDFKPNKRKSISDLRQKTRTQFREWNREFEALNASITRTMEEQEESSDCASSTASTSTIASRSSSSYRNTTDDDSSDDNRRGTREECSIM